MQMEVRVPNRRQEVLRHRKLVCVWDPSPRRACVLACLLQAAWRQPRVRELGWGEREPRVREPAQAVHVSR